MKPEDYEPHEIRDREIRNSLMGYSPDATVRALATLVNRLESRIVAFEGRVEALERRTCSHSS